MHVLIFDTISMGYITYIEQNVAPNASGATELYLG